MVQYGVANYSMVRQIIAWYGMVYGVVWYGMAWYGMVWYGMVWYDMVKYRMAFYSALSHFIPTISKVPK